MAKLDEYWGLLRALPLPLPVSNSSNLLPVVYLRNSTIGERFGVPYNSLVDSSHQGQVNLSIHLSGALCFHKPKFGADLCGYNYTGFPTPCINLATYSMGDVINWNESGSSYTANITGELKAFRSESLPLRCQECHRPFAPYPPTNPLPSCIPQAPPILQMPVHL